MQRRRKRCTFLVSTFFVKSLPRKAFASTSEGQGALDETAPGTSTPCVFEQS